MTTYGYMDRDGDRLHIEPSNIEGFTRFTTFTGRGEQTVIVPHEEAAALMLGVAQSAGWKTHRGTTGGIVSGSVEDWQADAVSSLLGAIRKAADDKVRAEMEAETEKSAAILYAATHGNTGTVHARNIFDENPGIRREWMDIASAARDHFTTTDVPF